jgi:hypothetical protein
MTTHSVIIFLRNDYIPIKKFRSHAHASVMWQDMQLACHVTGLYCNHFVILSSPATQNM